MADPYGAGALAALVEELKLVKHSEKLRDAGVTTLRELMCVAAFARATRGRSALAPDATRGVPRSLDDAGIGALALPKGPTAGVPAPALFARRRTFAPRSFRA